MVHTEVQTRVHKGQRQGPDTGSERVQKRVRKEFRKSSNEASDGAQTRAQKGFRRKFSWVLEGVQSTGKEVQTGFIRGSDRLHCRCAPRVASTSHNEDYIYLRFKLKIIIKILVFSLEVANKLLSILRGGVFDIFS